MSARKRRLVLSFALLLLPSCDGEPAGLRPVVQPRPVLTLSPPGVLLMEGATVQLQAVVTQSSNTAVRFRSSAPLVASVSAEGVVTGVAAGISTITAVAAADTTVRATSAITVVNLWPGITPTTATIQVGATQQFTAAGLGAVTFRSQVPAVATIDAAGLATGHAAGTTVISAISVADTTFRATAILTVR